jgi:hypothetical protein
VNREHLLRYYSLSDEQLETFLRVCHRRDVPLRFVLQADQYRDDSSYEKRSQVLSDLRKAGWDINSLLSLCPISERAIRRSLKKFRR